MIKTFPLLFPPRPDASTGPPTAAVVSAVSVLRPAGVGGCLAFVAVQESGHDDQNGPQEEHPVDDSRRQSQLKKL